MLQHCHLCYLPPSPPVCPHRGRPYATSRGLIPELALIFPLFNLYVSMHFPTMSLCLSHPTQLNQLTKPPCLPNHSSNSPLVCLTEFQLMSFTCENLHQEWAQPTMPRFHYSLTLPLVIAICLFLHLALNDLGNQCCVSYETI